MPSWNPEQYLQYKNERLRPVIDLIAQIPIDNPTTIIDLGCGTGTSTRLLKERFFDAKITGIDSSPAMLEKSQRENTNITWLLEDLNNFQIKEPVDLLFSNAVYHWLDNHENLFPQLIESLNPGGVLAIQMPNNFSAPTHTSITETVRSKLWSKNLESLLRIQPVLSPTNYYELFSPLVTYFNLWETTYYHLLEGENPVIEWTKGSALRPFLDLLEDDEATIFLEEYGKRIKKAYPQHKNRKTLLPFRRLFLIAVK